MASSGPSGTEGRRVVKTLTADVFGSVQGVGFRWFVQRAGLRLGLEVSAENRDDGTVHVVARGSEDRLMKLVDELRRGSPHSSVERVDYSITG
jgi:acylphosphatase